MAANETYLTVLIGVILGLAIARVISFSGELITRGENIKLYWVHLLWMVGLFLLLTQSWWAMRLDWNFSNITSLPEVSFLLVGPVLHYLASVVLCPTLPENDGAFDLRDTFSRSQDQFFVIIGALFLVLIPEAVLMSRHCVGWLDGENVVRFLVAASFFIAYFFVRKHPLFEPIFPILVIAALTVFLAVKGSTVGAAEQNNQKSASTNRTTAVCAPGRDNGSLVDIQNTAPERRTKVSFIDLTCPRAAFS